MKMNDHDGLNQLGAIYFLISIIGAIALLLSACDQWATASSARTTIDRAVLESAAQSNLAAAIAVGFSGFLVRGVLSWMVGVYKALAKLNGVPEVAGPVVPRGDSELGEQ